MSADHVSMLNSMFHTVMVQLADQLADANGFSRAETEAAMPTLHDFNPAFPADPLHQSTTVWSPSPPPGATVSAALQAEQASVAEQSRKEAALSLQQLSPLIDGSAQSRDMDPSSLLGSVPGQGKTLLGE